MVAGVDTTFDFHSDTPGRKDPDRFSPTLHKYQQLLWGKELPVGGRFDMRREPGGYLVHRSDRGVFFLASEAFTTRLRDKAARVIRTIPDDALPKYGGYTAGSTIVFPGNRIDRKMTINGARGFHPRIADRPDLTLECIRRHYSGELPNPLAGALARYADFFALFRTFPEYVKFFLLEDLLELDGQHVRSFLHPIGDFSTRDAVPKDKDEYLEYLGNSNAFISARNRRIDEQP
ncbi:DUF6994 family protein [Arthrobacter sp. NPDC058130]|uniref:DUF6994 family protein n=1 Tax=Arthrobacter sp. NPDC058130 TaxID=3346353 RepID=UPI0036EC4F6B